MRRLKLFTVMVAIVLVFALISCGVVVNPLQSEDIINMEEGDITSARNGGGDEIIMQGFDWNSRWVSGGFYNYLAGQGGWLSWLGVTMVWMPPPWQDWSPDGKGYLPRDLNKNSNYGSDWEFHNAINSLSYSGIKSIIDIVANHRDPGAYYGDGWSRNCNYGGWSCRKWQW